MSAIESRPAGETQAIETGPKRWRVGTLSYTAGGLVLLSCWLLWGDFAFSLKDRSVGTVVRIMLKKWEASDTTVAFLLGSLSCILGMLIGPVLSYRSDRHRGKWGRRIPYILVASPIVAAAMMGIAFSPQIGAVLHRALGGYSGGLNASILIVFAVFWAISEGATMVANGMFGALVNDVVPQEVMGRFFAMFRVMSLLAGIIFNYWLIGKSEEYFLWIFIGLGVLYAGGFLTICLKVKEGEYPPPPPVPPRKNRVQGFVAASRGFFRENFCQSYFLWYFAMTILSWLAFSPINMYSLFYAQSLNVSMDAFGKYTALSFACSFALSYPMGCLADRIHPLRAGLALQGVYLLVTGLGSVFIKDEWTFGVYFVLHTVVSGLWMTATAAFAQVLLPRERFAQLGAACGIVSSVVNMIWGPVMGVFLDYTHHAYRYTFIGSAVLTAIALAVGLVLYRKFAGYGGPHHYVPPE